VRIVFKIAAQTQYVADDLKISMKQWINSGRLLSVRPHARPELTPG
jgi:hypothetical protein